MPLPGPGDSAIPTIVTLAGIAATEGDRGDGGPATQALLSGASGVAVDDHRNVYIADSNNDRVRKVSADGTITTFAGTGDRGFSGDGGPATQTRLGAPAGVAVDGHGNVYISETDNSRVRKVSAVDGTITTLAGTGDRGFSGDGGPATQAQLRGPSGVAVDGHGNVYIADRINSRVRKVSAADSTITTFAGTGEEGFSGDGGPATQARLHGPSGVAVDDQGNVYIADRSNNRVRKVSADGTITTLAGTGKASWGDDGRPATQADLYCPEGVAVDGHGNVYFSESGPGYARVRKVAAVDGTIMAVAGTGRQGYGDDGGPATQSDLIEPVDVAVDGCGNIYIADGQRIRVVLAPVSLFGQLVVTAHSLSGDPVAHTQVRFILDGNTSARFSNNATSVEVMTNDYGIAAAPVITAGSNVGTFTVHVIELDNPKNKPTTRHPETTSG